jgi:DDE superfamily endonuclease
MAECALYNGAHMCILTMPILKELGWISDGVSELDANFTKPQKTNLVRLLTAMILLSTMTLSTVAVGWLGNISVNALSHFMSYSGLCGSTLMASAVRFTIRKFGLKGVPIRLAIDDTMEHHSKFCRCIANVYNLFDHALGSYCRAKCIVFAYVIVNETIRFPLGWRVYRQGGKKKWESALELVDNAIAYGFTIQVVLFDSWFCVEPFITALDKRKLVYISEIKSNQVAEFAVEDSKKSVKITLNKLFEYGKHLCKDVMLGLKSNDEKKCIRTLYKTQSITTYVSALGKKVRLIKSVDVRKGCYKIFVTNELSWDAQKILTEYSYRWMIEEFFRNAKQLFDLEGASIRSEQGGAIKLFLVSFADLLISLQLWKSAQASSHKGLPTVSAILAQAAEENLKVLLNTNDPDILKQIIDNWLKLCHAKQRKVRRERRNLANSNDFDIIPNESTENDEQTPEILLASCVNF